MYFLVRCAFALTTKNRNAQKGKVKTKHSGNKVTNILSTFYLFFMFSLHQYCSTYAGPGLKALAKICCQAKVAKIARDLSTSQNARWQGSPNDRKSIKLSKITNGKVTKKKGGSPQAVKYRKYRKNHMDFVCNAKMLACKDRQSRKSIKLSRTTNNEVTTRKGRAQQVANIVKIASISSVTPRIANITKVTNLAK